MLKALTSNKPYTPNIVSDKYRNGLVKNSTRPNIPRPPPITNIFPDPFVTTHGGSIQQNSHTASYVIPGET